MKSKAKLLSLDRYCSALFYWAVFIYFMNSGIYTKNTADRLHGGFFHRIQRNEQNSRSPDTKRIFKTEDMYLQRQKLTHTQEHKNTTRHFVGMYKTTYNSLRLSPRHIKRLSQLLCRIILFNRINW